MIKSFQELPPSIEVPKSLQNEIVEYLQLDSDPELPESFRKILERNRELSKQEKLRLIQLVDSMRDPKDPVSSTVISTTLAEQVFCKSNKLSAIEQIMLFQAVSDEIFGYGPLAAFLRVFPYIQIKEDGSFAAGDEVLKIEFDDALHKEETLAILKYARRSETNDGFVEYSSEGGWKITVPAKFAAEMDLPKTRLEKLGWSEEAIVFRTDSRSALKKALSWVADAFAFGKNND